MNKVLLFGRIASDIETTTYGKKKEGTLAKFSLAVRKDKDNADFFRCTAFGKTAELLEEYFDKGKQITITGHLASGSYESKKGETHYTTDIIVEEFDFISDGSNKKK